MLRWTMQKLAFLYKPYALAIVSVGYVLAELGHFLIGKSQRWLLHLLKLLICVHISRQI